MHLNRHANIMSHSDKVLYSDCTAFSARLNTITSTDLHKLVAPNDNVVCRFGQSSRATYVFACDVLSVRRTNKSPSRD